LGACRVIIQDDDFALACTDLFSNKRKDLLRPFRREVTKQVFFVDGFALQDKSRFDFDSPKPIVLGKVLHLVVEFRG